MLFECPCCGYATLTVRSRFENCFLCDWEDDGQDDHNADIVLGGPNVDYSLTEARNNFQKYGNMFRASHVSRKGDSPTEIKAKKRIIEAFEQIKTAKNDEEKGKYWRRIGKNRNILRQELRKLILRSDEQVIRPRLDTRLECLCCGYGTISSNLGQFCYLCGWYNDKDSQENHVSDHYGTRIYKLEEARENFEDHLSFLDVNDPKYYSSIRLVNAKKKVMELFGEFKDAGPGEDERIKDDIMRNLNIIHDEVYNAADRRKFRLKIQGLYEELT